MVWISNVCIIVSFYLKYSRLRAVVFSLSLSISLKKTVFSLFFPSVLFHLSIYSHLCNFSLNIKLQQPVAPRPVLLCNPFIFPLSLQHAVCPLVYTVRGLHGFIFLPKTCMHIYVSYVCILCVEFISPLETTVNEDVKPRRLLVSLTIHVQELADIILGDDVQSVHACVENIEITDSFTLPWQYRSGFSWEVHSTPRLGLVWLQAYIVLDVVGICVGV